MEKNYVEKNLRRGADHAFMIPFMTIRLLDILDILIVAAVLYKLIMIIRGTRAVQLIQGLAVIFIAAAVSRWLGLYTINWLLRNTITLILVALPIVFQPELRRALEQLGRGKLLTEPINFLGKEDDRDMQHIATAIVQSVMNLARNKTGALIVMERKTGLNDFIETGVTIEGIISAELLGNVFVPNTPLHDGAVIIRGNRIIAAGCFLPLTENPHINKNLGTRHRAALGISEETDALVIIVSEETGIISIAENGFLKRFIDEETLTTILKNLYQPKPSRSFNLKKWRGNRDE